MARLAQSGIKFLLDTGSTNSLISRRGAEKLGIWGRQKRCGCAVSTVSGKCNTLGEISFNLLELSGYDERVRIHVIQELLPGYDLIIGGDILRRVGLALRVSGDSWQYKVGNQRFRTRTTGNQGNIKIGAVDCTTDTIRRLLTRNDDLFYREDDPLPTTGRTLHRIHLKTETPVYVKNRRYPQALRDIIQGQLSELLKQGIIRHSNSPFNSPLWVVEKKQANQNDPIKQYRVVVDYRKLNEATKDERYPLPRVEDILDRLSGATIFSTLDLKSGYHQVRMAEEDIGKTAFSWDRGHFEFVRMPFGLKGAPLTFQRLMDEVQRGLGEQFSQIYMDDLIVFSRSEAEHVEHLKRVLNRIREFGLKLSKEKSKFGLKEIKFLGYTVSREGVQPDPDRVKAIQEAPLPKNSRGIRRFLGMVNYYRKFIPGIAELTQPLTEVLKKGRRFHLGTEQLRCIKQCQDILTSRPLLAFPDFHRTFRITTDASEIAIGAVLSQNFDEGEKPIAYAGRKLTDAERRYSAIERELLAVVWAVEYFRPYVYGRKFELLTDHKPLVYLGTLKESSARVSRWKERLAAYNFQVIHKKGVDNAVADWLSRDLVINAVEEEDPPTEPFALRYLREWAESGPEIPLVQSPVERTPTPTDPPTDFPTPSDRPSELPEIEDIVNDKRFQLIIKSKQSPGTETKASVYEGLSTVLVRTPASIDENELERLFGEFSVPGRACHVYVGNRLIAEKLKRLWRAERIGVGYSLTRCLRQVETITDTERQQRLVADHHTGKTNHRGIEETLRALKLLYFWKSMGRTVRDCIAQCVVCQRAKYDRQPPVAEQVVTLTDVEPLRSIQVDVYANEGQAWLTAIDPFSKIAMAHPIESKSPQTVWEGVLHWCATYGVPDEVVSDCGREFDNARIREEAKTLGINWRLNTPHHIKGRGAVERLHSTLGEHLRLLKLGRNLDPYDAMPRAIIAYNNTIHAATGLSPVEIVFGQRRRDRGDLITVNSQGLGEELRMERVKRRETWAKVREKLVKEKHSRVDRANNRAMVYKKGPLPLGTIVYRRLRTARTKSAARYEGPYKIITIRENNLFTIKDIQYPFRSRTVHLEELRIPKIVSNPGPGGDAQPGPSHG